MSKLQGIACVCGDGGGRWLGALASAEFFRTETVKSTNLVF